MAACSDPSLRDLIEMAWETGARPQELRAIEARHYRREESRFVLPPQESKGKRYHRVIYLGSDRARDIVDRRIAEFPTGPLLRNSRGDPWTKDAINCAFRRLRAAMAEAVMERDGKPRPALGGRPKADDPGRKAGAASLAAWKTELARVAAEVVPPLHLGAFRKGYATEALKAGIDTLSLAHLLGHRDGAMVSRVYGKVQQDPSHMADVARRAKRVKPS